MPTKQELLVIAKSLNIRNRHAMTKDKLEQAIADAQKIDCKIKSSSVKGKSPRQKMTAVIQFKPAKLDKDLKRFAVTNAEEVDKVVEWYKKQAPYVIDSLPGLSLISIDKTLGNRIVIKIDVSKYEIPEDLTANMLGEMMADPDDDLNEPIKLGRKQYWICYTGKVEFHLE